MKKVFDGMIVYSRWSTSRMKMLFPERARRYDFSYKRQWGVSQSRKRNVEKAPTDGFMHKGKFVEDCPSPFMFLYGIE